jgi:parallel beta-helix repeat protein
MFVFLLVSMLTFAFNTKSVKASGTIYIRADGSIDPPTAPISTFDNITYTFTGNIANESIVVQRDNVVLEGAGHTLQGPGTGGGIELVSVTNVTVKNTQITDWEYGIGLVFSYNIIISGNNVTANHCGIDLGFSQDNIVSGNTVADTTGYASIQLVSSSSNSIFNNNVTANGFDGIRIDSSSNNLISGNNLSANGNCGIELSGSSYPFSSDYNIISGNDISSDYIGIVLSNSNYNIISGNNALSSTSYGICLLSSSNNTILENNITANSGYGISLWSTSDNVIFHNNFENNTQQVYSDTASMNTWDNGYPIGGNYWSDYNGTDFYCGPCQNETGSDGIGDASYTIDANNTDNYPLMNPWAPPDIAVSDLSASKTIIGQGYTGTVNLTLENQGNKIEAFNASVCANSTLIYSESIMLAMTNQTLSFIWNTTGFAYGNYAINAYVEPLLEEIDVADNNCTCSVPIHVGVPGDVSSSTPGVYDKKCDMWDIAYLVSLFNTKPDSSNWNPNADVNNDGTVNMKDIAIAILNFNKHE